MTSAIRSDLTAKGGSECSSLPTGPARPRRHAQVRGGGRHAHGRRGAGGLPHRHRRAGMPSVHGERAHLHGVRGNARRFPVPLHPAHDGPPELPRHAEAELDLRRDVPLRRESLIWRRPGASLFGAGQGLAIILRRRRVWSRPCPIFCRNLPLPNRGRMWDNTDISNPNKKE